MISLGCAKNLVDAEIMLGSLIQDGIEITNDAGSADVLIVNTCSFIDAAQEESVDTILESAELREAQNRGQALVVSGCLPQRFKDQLPQLLPEVDAFMGIDQVAQVPCIIREAVARRGQRLSQPRARSRRQKVVQQLSEAKVPLSTGQNPEVPNLAPMGGSSADHSLVQVNARPQYIPDYGTPRFRLTPRHFAYLKIAEGCNHPCSFCIIPRMRGAHRSRALPDILKDAEQLISDGVKEINLISQDSTYYGLDLRPERRGSIASPDKFQAATRNLPASNPTLSTLLRELNALPGEFWVRLLYTHPAHWTDELIETIAACPKVVRYVDMPLQHIHDNMLERMRRETSQEHIVSLIRKIRSGIPGIALRTTFIVGFPGETERCFETLLDFIQETRFERLGVFTYSHEEGTRAAMMMSQVPDQVKHQRRERIMATQLKIARELGKASVGQELKVLVEKAGKTSDGDNGQVSSWEHGLLRNGNTEPHEFQGRYVIARGEADAPDIDGRVYVRGKLAVGDFATVKVVGHTDYDLLAEPLPAAVLPTESPEKSKRRFAHGLRTA